MSYCIVYGPMPDVPQIKRDAPLRLQILTASFLLFFALMVRLTWAEGTQMIRRILTPAEPTVTEAAFTEMIGEIQSGESVPEAFTAFCRQIVTEGIEETN